VSATQSRADGAARLSVRDLWRLRRAHLAAQRARLRLQDAEQSLRELALELEHRYRLLGSDTALDIHTGLIMPSTETRGRADSQGQDGAAGGGE
jgi:hypothetical protein